MGDVTTGGGAQEETRMPNPAHQRCIADGYGIEVISRDGVPIDADCVARATGRRCRVWDYYRGDCVLDGTEGTRD
jgi:putative hemolysin